MMRASSVLAACALWVLPNLASAHILMLSPKPRTTELKVGPCGAAGSVRGKVVTTVESGSTLHLEWEQMFDHPSHFRVAFDSDGQNDFVDPKSINDRYTNAAVLIDGISSAGGGPFSVDVPLPQIECDNCTLQLIQVMYDKAPYKPGTDDIYYQCADLVLKRGLGGGGASTDAGVSMGDAGTRGGGARDAGATGAGGLDGGSPARGDGGLVTSTSNATAGDAEPPRNSTNNAASAADTSDMYTCSAGRPRRARWGAWSLLLLFGIAVVRRRRA